MADDGDFQRQFTRVMEKLLHNAVSETIQLFENSVQEIKAEIVRVRKENDNLNGRLYIFEKERTSVDPGKDNTSTSKDKPYKRDIGVQCAWPTQVERSCSPYSENGDERSRLQNLCPSLSEEENRQLALVLIKQEELDFDDHSTGYFLLKQEDGEPKLVRRQHIKDVPPEVFTSSAVRRKTTEKSLSGEPSSESTSSDTKMDTDEHRTSTLEVNTRGDTEVKNGSERREVNQEKIFQEKAALSVQTSAKKTGTLRASQTQSTAGHLPQPYEPPKCTAARSQVPVSTSLPMCKQSKVLIQTSLVRIQSAPHPLSKQSTIPPQRSLKSAPPPQVPHVSAQIPGSPPSVLSNQVANITNPSAQFCLSPDSHWASQGQMQCKPTQVPVPQAPQFQVLPHTTQLPNSQTNIITSAGQVLLPAGISQFQSVPSPLQPCRMPVSTGFSLSLSQPTVVSTVAPISCVALHPVPPAHTQAHPNQLPRPQHRIPSQTQVLPSPVSLNSQGQQNTAKYTQTPSPFTHMSATAIPPFASFSNITTSKSVISQTLMMTSPPAVQNLPLAPNRPVHVPLQSTLPSSSCLQTSAVTTVPPPGSLSQASRPVLSTVTPHPLPQIQAPLQIQSNTPPAPLQQSPASCAVSSGMVLYQPIKNPVRSHMPPVPPSLSSASCPALSNMTSLPVEHNPSLCQIGSNSLVALLQNSTPTLMPATRPSVPIHQVQTPPPVHSVPVSFHSPHETPQVPMSYPLDSLYASLDPMHDLEEEPTLTTLHPPSMFDRTGMLSEHLSSVSSQQCVPLTQPCIASHQFPSAHSESLTLSEHCHSTSTNEESNGQFKNFSTCPGPPSVSTQESDGSSTSIKNDVPSDGQWYSDSVLLRPKSHFKTHQESNKTSARQSDLQNNDLDDSEEPKASKHQLSNDGLIQTEGDMAPTSDMASQNTDSAEDDKEVKQKNVAKPGKTQARKNQCEVCGRVLSNASALENHSRLHTGERPFSCDKCGKAFPSVRGLNRHVQIHAEEKQHQCPECGKSFVYHFTLTKHQLIHTGEKPFPCKVCGKRFLAKADRATHMRMHTGEKPYSCTLCGKKFKHRMALNMHMQGHRGEKRYSCPTCGKGFVDLGNFKRHKRIHTGEKPYECTFCGKRFTQSAHLKKHVNTQH